MATSTTADAAAAAEARPFPLHTGIATVATVRRLTPRMARITLTGAALAGFPDEQPGEILTLIWPAEGRDAPILPETGWRFPPGTPDQHARNYTIRAYDPSVPELTIDLVLHGDHGIASRWATRVQPGDVIGFAGPRVHFFPDAGAHLTILAGDETALPSIAATLERLPRDHKVFAFIEVHDEAERLELAAACDAAVRWVHRDGVHAGRSTLLLDAVRDAALPPCDPARAKVWVAGESLAVRGLREHLKGERGLTIGPMQAIGYWKHRDTPDDVDD